MESVLGVIDEDEDCRISDCESMEEDEPVIPGTFVFSAASNGTQILQKSSSSPFEEGEVPQHEVSQVSVLVPSANLQVVTNDLDLAIQRAKQPKKRRKKPKTQRSLRVAANEKANFVTKVCQHLKEPKRFLVEAAVSKLGIEAVRNLVKEVEKNGGQMTADGKRRRTPGGVLWNVLKAHQPENFQTVMAIGKQVEVKGKHKLERGVDVAGEPQRKKMRGGSPHFPRAEVKKTGRTFRHSRPKEDVLASHRGDPDNGESRYHALSAWIEGVKQGKDHLGSRDLGKTSVFERLRAPVQYDDLAT